MTRKLCWILAAVGVALCAAPAAAEGKPKAGPRRT
jgi:hypothetical protein